MNTIEKYKKYVNTAMVAKVEPVVISKAKGATVTDIEGKQYIDCFAGISVVNAGHCNEKVIEAAKAQMDKLVHCCSYVYYSQPTADLAEKLAEITPGRLQKTFLRKRRGRGHRRSVETGQAVYGKDGIYRPSGLVPRPVLCHAERNRKLCKEEKGWTLHGGLHVSAYPLLLPVFF